MTALRHEEVELLAIGAGPSNLALAVAAEELTPADLAKDLVTLRNPCSAFSFVNYPHVNYLSSVIGSGRDPATAGCYPQGMNEDSQGLADSLLSVLAIRAGEIVDDVLTHRIAVPDLLASVAASR